MRKKDGGNNFSPTLSHKPISIFIIQILASSTLEIRLSREDENLSRLLRQKNRLLSLEQLFLAICYVLATNVTIWLQFFNDQ